MTRGEPIAASMEARSGTCSGSLCSIPPTKQEYQRHCTLHLRRRKNASHTNPFLKTSLSGPIRQSMAAQPLSLISSHVGPPEAKDDVSLLREQLFSLQLALESRERAIDQLRNHAETILWSVGSEVSLFPQNLPCIAFLKDAEGRYIFVNQLWEKIHEKGLAEWHNKTDDELFPSDTAQIFRQTDLEVIQTGSSLQSVSTFVSGGQTTWCLVTKFPV